MSRFLKLTQSTHDLPVAIIKAAITAVAASNPDNPQKAVAVVHTDNHDSWPVKETYDEIMAQLEPPPSSRRRAGFSSGN